MSEVRHYARNLQLSKEMARNLQSFGGGYGSVVGNSNATHTGGHPADDPTNRVLLPTPALCQASIP
jgi:hypothetical protein